MEKDRAQRVGSLAAGVGRAAWRLLPEKLRRRLEDRFFYALFQTTRVENDDYGWRPPPPGEGEEEPADPETAGDTA